MLAVVEAWGEDPTATVQALHADNTQTVKQGQLLIEMDPSVAEVNMRAAEANLARAARAVREWPAERFAEIAARLRATGARVTIIAGASGHTSQLAAAVTVACLESCLAGLEPGVHLLGGPTLDSPALLRRAVALGVRLQEYTGVARATSE